MESILIADDHPLTREALAVASQPARVRRRRAGVRRAGGDRRGRRAAPAPRPARPDDAGDGRPDRAAAHPRGVARERGRRADRVRDGREPARGRSGGAAGYLLKSEPPERIAALPARRRARGGRAFRLDRPAPARPCPRGRPAWAGSPTRSPRSCSAREVEVLLLLDEHLGTDEIAARLYISEHTVRSHVKSLLRKLGVSSRREALEPLHTAR